MARPLRISFENAVYHITARGNERRDIFKNDEDRERFLDYLRQVVERYGWILHVYCLMTNHYHLLVETPRRNISSGMRQLNGVYTQGFNRLYKRIGHLFQGRFKGILVQKGPHLLELCRYVVLNPVRAKVCRQAGDYRWSSHRAVVGAVRRPSFLTTSWVLAQFGRSPDRAIKAYAQFVAEGLGDRPWDRLKGQVYYGDEAFVREMALCEDDVPEVPRAQKMPLRPPLADVLAKEGGMKEAHEHHGYFLREIAAHLGVHYATVSRRLKALSA